MKTEKTHSTFMRQLLKHIEGQSTEKSLELLKTFATRYFINVADVDLMEMGIERAYDHLLSMWHLAYERSPGECKINIRCSPAHDQTIIEVSHDDMPFLVDTIRMAVNLRGFLIDLMIHTGGMVIARDKHHRLTQVFSPDDLPSTITSTEAPICVTIDKLLNEDLILALKQDLQLMLDDVTVAVRDFPLMRDRLVETAAQLTGSDPVDIKQFFDWLRQDNFIFLGCEDYKFAKVKNKTILRAMPASGLGILSTLRQYELPKDYFALPPEIEALDGMPNQTLIVTKANMKATVHRDVYADDIILQQFDQQGKVIGIRRFLGIYTSAAYNSNPNNIPFLSSKLNQVLKKSKLKLNSYIGKELKSVLENLPRDDLFQADVDELLTIAIKILHLREKQKLGLLIRQEAYRRFFSCLVFVPRDRFNTRLRQRIQAILMKALRGEEVSFETRFPNNVLARVHFLIHIKGEAPKFNPEDIKAALVASSRIWQDDFLDALVEHFGEGEGRDYFERYENIFPASYQEAFTANMAVSDLRQILNVSEAKPLDLNFSSCGDKLCLKLFQLNKAIPLSDVLPILENMGVKVLDDSPHKIVLNDRENVFINNFELLYLTQDAFDAASIKTIFEEAFTHIWHGVLENDGFNQLVLHAALNWRAITVLRAYAKYMHQIGFGFSQKYIERALAENAEITQYLIQLFLMKFDPSLKSDARDSEKIDSKINTLLENVMRLDQDRILRRYWVLIQHTLRTNYFKSQLLAQTDKMRLSFKLDCEAIPDLPLPKPLYEIFVYSPQFEGVHLREGRIARGGIRWSDRLEDFRTEILGLVKAQNVKNSIIVPAGAKGGFVIKCLPSDATRELTQKTGVACYQEFIRGLLDITDNIKNRKTIRPLDVVCYDEEDPYLVVAADKGTAAFSDIANKISAQYDFWLGDAFASGGSAGYDHKKMGITARGAWESVKQHFYLLGVDARKETLTIVGIGDMSGDVFGNGLLLSRHTKLIAAFDHRHIFVDPAPDIEKSFLERRRLFHLPRSSWADYHLDLISAGGGVFDRSAKSITVTSAMKSLFLIDEDQVTPNALIRVILKAKFDLLFNGGIGTFVKSQLETSAMVGDRHNDAIRVNGSELRCLVVAEGGNLGFTERGRIEYALKGGHIYTDFIDNSAGVDCSDHEVNIKILLNQVMQTHVRLTLEQRDALLLKMTNDVAKLVLRDNEYQTLAIELATIDTAKNLELYANIISSLEKGGLLNRELEALPTEEVLVERRRQNQGLTKPEVSVLITYQKIMLKQAILQSDIPEDKNLLAYIFYAFPDILREQYLSQLSTHMLKREIIATQISNHLINTMGITFIYRLQEETGASMSDIVKAMHIAEKIFDVEPLRREIYHLKYNVALPIQLSMLKKINRLIRRATRWFLRNRSESLTIQPAIKAFAPYVAELDKHLVRFLPKTDKARLVYSVEQLVEVGVSHIVAKRVADCEILLSALDIVQAVLESKFSIKAVATAYFTLGALLDLNWLRVQISALPVKSRWEALARAHFRDDLDRAERLMTVTALSSFKSESAIRRQMEHWLKTHAASISHWVAVVKDLRALGEIDSVMLSVVLRELRYVANAVQEMD